MNNTKNYKTDGGDTWVVGGKLVVEDTAEVDGLIGITTPAENQADSVAEEISELVADFNGLLLKLKTAGIMTAD